MLHSAPRTRIAGLVLALLVTGGGAVACSGDDGSETRPGAGGGASAGADREGRDASGGPADVRTVVVPGAVAGRLAAPRHREVSRRVARVVDGWWDAAFVEADYPRSRYQGSFPGFTPAASAQAWRQRDLMTSLRVGDRIDDLVPLRRRVAVDVLATRQVPRAATARVRMDYRTTGRAERRVRVQGRLLLTFQRGWKVFGFDVTQSPVPAPQRPVRDRKKGRQ